MREEEARQKACCGPLVLLKAMACPTKPEAINCLGRSCMAWIPAQYNGPDDEAQRHLFRQANHGDCAYVLGAMGKEV